MRQTSRMNAHRQEMEDMRRDLDMLRQRFEELRACLDAVRAGQ